MTPLRSQQFLMVRFTSRWANGMWKQLLDYAKDEEISIMAALRQIVSDFFRRRNATGIPPKYN